MPWPGWGKNQPIQLVSFRQTAAVIDAYKKRLFDGNEFFFSIPLTATGAIGKSIGILKRDSAFNFFASERSSFLLNGLLNKHYLSIWVDLDTVQRFW